MGGKAMVRIGLILLLYGGSLLSSCRHDLSLDDREENGTISGVPATRTGEGTMGAVVDGKRWVAGFYSPLGSHAATAIPSYGGLTITGIRETLLPNGTQVIETIRIFVNPQGPGTWNVTAGAASFHRSETTSGSNGTTLATTYLVPDGQSGTLTITRYDPQLKILAGSFRFTASHTFNDQISKISIEHGIFDVRIE